MLTEPPPTQPHRRLPARQGILRCICAAIQNMSNAREAREPACFAASESRMSVHTKAPEPDARQETSTARRQTFPPNNPDTAGSKSPDLSPHQTSSGVTPSTYHRRPCDAVAEAAIAECRLIPRSGSRAFTAVSKSGQRAVHAKQIITDDAVVCAQDRDRCKVAARGGSTVKSVSNTRPSDCDPYPRARPCSPRSIQMVVGANSATR